MQQSMLLMLHTNAFAIYFVFDFQIFEEIKARKALVDLDLFRLHVLYNTTLAAALGLIDM